MAYRREIRLGLVLYGGVSLAVYENGIAQELHRAIRGDQFYGLLKCLIDSDIVIDIISGTSAGGINGIMLAYALANQREFAPAAQLWREDGDIEKLMRRQNDLEASSILDSDFYHRRLLNCYAVALAPDKTAPEIGELDLFVTSTDANGAISTVFDDLGHAIDIKNHRALFKLSYRPGRKNDLGVPPDASATDMPALQDDLARLSRMTSCFPVAFQPVRVAAGQQKFFRWGKLRDPAVFLDGGLLNNKPFTSTIDAIAGRTATREVERFLIYVEPKPERFSPAVGSPPAPAIVQAAIDALVTIPGYQSIAGDLAEIEAHNERAARTNEILSSLLDGLEKAPASPSDCMDQTGVIGPSDDPCDPTAYYTARLIQLRDTAVQSILDDKDGRAYFPSMEVKSNLAKLKIAAAASPSIEAATSTPADDRRSGRILVQSFNAWPGEGLVSLQRYDVFFRMRRATYLADTLMRAAKNGADVPLEAFEAVNHHFKLYEMAQWAMIRRLTLYDFGWQRLSEENSQLDVQPQAVQSETLIAIAKQFWGQVEAQLRDFLYAGTAVPASQTRQARKLFYNQLDTLSSPAPSTSAPINLLDDIDNQLKQAIAALAQSQNPATVNIADTLRKEFCRFLDVDRQLFLVQIGSGFESTDMIRVVRFSPLDAQRCLSQGDIESKVRGSTVAAFGGFFKKSWRAGDIMMGRLDGTCLLIECLLTKERLAALAPQRKSNPASVLALEIFGCFPSLAAPAAAALAATINAYLLIADTATDAQWNDLIDQIVGACHNEIFKVEYPNVVRCAIEQEYQWGRYRQNPNLPAAHFNQAHLVWNRGIERPDEVLVQVASTAIAVGQVKPFAPGLQPAGSFLEDIPESVLEELIALATIRLGKGLIASIPNPRTASRIEGRWFYRLPFKWIAPLLYNFARTRRTQPATVVLFNTLIPAICLTLIVLAAALFITGVFGLGAHFRLGALLFAVPAVILIAWAAFFRR